MDDPKALEVAAFAAQRAGNYAVAIEHWTALLNAIPNWEEGYGHNNLAHFYFQAGRFAEAEAAHLRALEIDPTNRHFVDGVGINAPSPARGILRLGRRAPALTPRRR